MTPVEKKFNSCHSANRVNRVVIERAFALLKGRFCRLQFTNTRTITAAVKIIMASCVLHNTYILQGDDIKDYLNQDNADDVVQQPPVPFVENEAKGVIKRNILAQNFI